MGSGICITPLLRSSDCEMVVLERGTIRLGTLMTIRVAKNTLQAHLVLNSETVLEKDIDDISNFAAKCVRERASDWAVGHAALTLTYGIMRNVFEWDYTADEDECQREDDEELTTVPLEPDWEVDESQDTLHLSVLTHERNHTKYHLVNEKNQIIGMVASDHLTNTVTGRVEFWKEPSENEANGVGRLLARQFADGAIEHISFTMDYEDNHIGDLHLERHQPNSF